MTRPDILNLDYETYSELNLKQVGLSRYVRHESTEILMAAYRWNKSEIRQWVPAETVGTRDQFRTSEAYRMALKEDMPRDLYEGFLDPTVFKKAFNATFERAVTAEVIGLDVPPAEWRCTMVHALCMSLPGKLEKAGEALELPDVARKDTRGTSLIKFFCEPRKETKTRKDRRNLPRHSMQKWNGFKDYNRQDVIAEGSIADVLDPYPIPWWEWDVWALDQEINDRGIPINLDLVDNINGLIRRFLDDRFALMREETGLENPNSNDQLLPWLRKRGYRFLDLKKGHVSRAREELAEEDKRDGYTGSSVVRVLGYRQETSKASIKKFKAYADTTDNDGWLRYAMQFAGAGRTWRWAGRKVQVQNLIKPTKEFEKKIEETVFDLEDINWEEFVRKYSKPIDAITTSVRPTIQAKRGYLFVDADLNAIENRVLGWMAKDDKILEVFRKKQDPYIAFGVYMFKIAYETLFEEYKVKGDGTKRTVCKPAVLGCGYGLGKGTSYENEQTGEIEANGLLGYAWNMGVKLTEEEAERSVYVWRDAFRDAVQYWYEIEDAAHRCVQDWRRTSAGPVEFTRDHEWLRMWLPSGRALSYHRPILAVRKTPWGADKLTLCYRSLNTKNQWVETRTYGGKLTENGDQAISRDLLVNGMMLAAKEGLPIVLHVHDQIVGHVRERDADMWLKILIECMAEPPKWGRDIPLGVAGHVSKVFLKD